jgi:hypothetical protein
MQLGKLDVCQAEQDLSCKTANNGAQDNQWVNEAKQNRKPADQLALVRAQIAALKAEEASIRKGLVDGELDLEGDDYRAVVTVVTNERLDLRRMRQHVDAAIWSPFLIATPTTYVRVEKRSVAQESYPREFENENLNT